MATIFKGRGFLCLFLYDGIKDQVAITALIPKNTNSMVWFAKKEKPLNAEKVKTKGKAAQCMAQSIEARKPRKSLLNEKNFDKFIVLAILLQLSCVCKFMQHYCNKQV